MLWIWLLLLTWTDFFFRFNQTEYWKLSRYVIIRELISAEWLDEMSHVSSVKYGTLTITRTIHKVGCIIDTMAHRTTRTSSRSERVNSQDGSHRLTGSWDSCSCAGLCRWWRRSCSGWQCSCREIQARVRRGAFVQRRGSKHMSNSTRQREHNNLVFFWSLKWHENKALVRLQLITGTRMGGKWAHRDKSPDFSSRFCICAWGSHFCR